MINSFMKWWAHIKTLGLADSAHCECGHIKTLGLDDSAHCEYGHIKRLGLADSAHKYGHIKRLGLADSAHCEYGSEEQCPKHILQTCQHLDTAHKACWQTDTDSSIKLWGPVHKLSRTADFLVVTGLRMYCSLYMKHRRGQGLWHSG